MKGKYIELNLDDLSGEGIAFAVSGGTVAGRKDFVVAPELAGALDPLTLTDDAHAVTEAYLTSELTKGTGSAVTTLHKVTSDDITAGGFTLEIQAAPTLTGAAAACVVGGPVLVSGLDFDFSEDGASFVWTDFALADRIEVDDVIRVVYKGVRE